MSVMNKLKCFRSDLASKNSYNIVNKLSVRAVLL
jgi:hypothetical protein